MVAPKGTHPFTSEESRNAEEEASKIVTDEIAKRPHLRLLDHLTYADLTGGAPRFAYQGGGKPTSLEPDPGFIVCGTTVVAIPEVKYQKGEQNAVERCFRWLAVACLPHVRLPLDRLIFAFYGDAFRKNTRGHICGQGGGVIELCSHLPIRLLVNATPDEFRTEFLDLLNEIERNPTRRAP